MQPRGAPGPGPSFSQGNLLGRPAHPPRLPGRVSPLIPVLRKTVRLDAFSQSYIPQAPGRPGLGAQARSVLPQETGNSLGPRKLSSISLTLRPNSQAWEEVPTLGKKAAVHGRGTMSTPESPSLILVPGGRVHSEGPGNPGLAKPSRMPVMEKPLVSSHLALPFQPRLAQDPPGPAGPGPAGQRHPVPTAAQVPARASPGRGRPRPRGTLRPRLHLQRTIPTMAPARAMDLVTLDTMGGTVRHSATMATNSPSLAVNLATSHTPRLDTGTEFPALDAKLGTATELATEGTAKQGLVTNPVTPDPDKLGKAIATAGTAKPYTTTGATAEDLAAPDPVKLGTARPDGVLALDRADPARRDITTGSPALHTSRLGICMGSVVPAPLNPAIGETTLDSAIHLTTLDTTTYPPMPSRGRDSALGHATADAATDPARKTKGKCKALGWDALGYWGEGGRDRRGVGGPGDRLHLDRWESGVDSKVTVKCTGGGQGCGADHRGCTRSRVPTCQSRIRLREATSREVYGVTCGGSIVPSPSFSILGGGGGLGVPGSGVIR